MQEGLDFVDASRKAIGQLEGSFSIVVMHEDCPDKLVAAKSATPIVIGLGDNENFVASDIPAILDHTRRVLFLEDGEMAEVTRDEVKVTTFAGEPVVREPRTVAWDPVTAQKGGYRHFLLKEIHEQPQAIIDTMRGRLLQEQADVSLDELASAPWLAEAKRITLVACGTAWHACLVGKYFLEQITRIPSDVDYGSEFRYRDPVVEPGTVLIVVSQSGETADTLAAVEAARERGAKVLAICNVVDSSIARRADAVIYTHAGPEICVASTKAFTTQLTVFYLLGLYLARRRGLIDHDAAHALITDLVNLPALIEECLAARARHREDRQEVRRRQELPLPRPRHQLPDRARGRAQAEGDLLHPRRGLCRRRDEARADRAHQRGDAGGRAPSQGRGLREEPFEHERGRVARRAHHRGHRRPFAGARGHRLGDHSGADQRTRASCRLLLTIPLQLLAYYIAVYRGSDVDMPRNLAKSVTVE